MDSFPSHIYTTNPKRNEKGAWRFVAGILIVLALGVAGVLYLIAGDRPASAFPQTVSIASGSSVRVATNELGRRNLVRYPRLLELYVTVVSGGKVVSGDYLFTEPLPLSAIASRITEGNYGGSQIRITIPEGSTVQDIARILDAALPQFDSGVFLAAAKGKEGYLFPDTYFVFPSMTEIEIVQKLERNFNTRIQQVQDDIDISKRSLSEIITMASIIEREATGDVIEQRTISGILWKRIGIGMLLQVDAPFWFLLGKGSSDLTREDLAIDSRYNTYRYKGLPPTPISNPGMSAIQAALNPIESDFLFYLHDADGIVHYATTHNEHVNNKNKYLK